MQDAREFISQHEHLGDVGLGVWHYGMFLDDRLAVVQSFGTTCFNLHRGAISEICKRHSLKAIQLCRGATANWAPKNAPSRAIGLSLRELRTEFGPVLVVAYADPRFGEVGTIYQACNAICLGWTDPKGQANYIIQGRRMSGWAVRKLYGTRDRVKLAKIDPSLQVIALSPKIRYAMVVAPCEIKRHALRELSALSIQNPKRENLGIPSMDVSGGIRRSAS